MLENDSLGFGKFRADQRICVGSRSGIGTYSPMPPPKTMHKAQENRKSPE